MDRKDKRRMKNAIEIPLSDLLGVGEDITLQELVDYVFEFDVYLNEITGVELEKKHYKIAKEKYGVNLKKYSKEVIINALLELDLNEFEKDLNEGSYLKESVLERIHEVRSYISDNWISDIYLGNGEIFIKNNDHLECFDILDKTIYQMKNEILYKTDETITKDKYYSLTTIYFKLDRRKLKKSKKENIKKGINRKKFYEEKYEEAEYEIQCDALTSIDSLVDSEVDFYNETRDDNLLANLEDIDWKKVEKKIQEMTQSKENQAA